MLFEEFENQIRQLGQDCASYASENERIFSQARGANLDAASVVRAGVTAREQLKERYDGIHERLAAVGEAYWHLNEKERGEARELVGHNPELLRQLFNHLGWESARVRGKSDQQLLMWGLAAISMVDLRTDSRDLLMAMGKVYLQAHQVGAFLSVPLVRVAEISNPLPRPPNKTSMRDFFMEFEESAYFRSAVLTKLDAKT